jgi:hypothetical protein
VGGVAIAPGVPTAPSTQPAAPTISFNRSSARGGRPARDSPGAPTCPLAVSLNTFPTGTLKTPYYYQYNLGVEQQARRARLVRVDYVGTRGRA